MNGSLAKRYAKALFEAIPEASLRETANRDLQRFAIAVNIKEPEMGVSIANLATARHVPAQTRVSLVRALAEKLQLCEKVQRLTKVMAERGRIDGVKLVARHFRDLVDASLGRVRVEVRSAMPLQTGQTEKLREALAASTEHEVVLDTTVDPSLIGGLSVHFKSLTVDRSVKRALNDIRESFDID